MKKICVIGCGYIGLPLAMHLAKVGYKVVGVDNNGLKVDLLNNGNLTLIEDGIEDLWNNETVKSNISFATKVEFAEVFIIAVPTPLEIVTRRPDLSAVHSAIDMILDFVKPGNLIIVESTVPPGTCQKYVYNKFKQEKSRELTNSLFIAHCPERVLPGNIMKEFVENDRIIGGINKESAIRAKSIYDKFITGECYLTDLESAEFAKLAENTFRMINIAFANELEVLANHYNIKSEEIISLANKHPRVNILNPGIGVGGQCITTDPIFLVEESDSGGELIRLALSINSSRPDIIANRITNYIREKYNLKEAKILLLGKSYKPNVKDDRESPAKMVAEILTKKGFFISHYDPFFDKVQNIEDLISDHNCIILLVKHSSFVDELNQKYEKLQKMLHYPNLIIKDPLKIPKNFR